MKLTEKYTLPGFLITLLIICTFQLNAEPVEEEVQNRLADPLSAESLQETASEEKAEESGILLSSEETDFPEETASIESPNENIELPSPEETVFPEKTAALTAPDPYDPYYYEDYDDLDDYMLFEATDLVVEAPVFVPRTYTEIFPNLTGSQRRRATSSAGVRNAFEKNEKPVLLPSPNSGINLLNSVMQKNPSHIVEALIVIPYTDRELDLVDIYNALGRIERIKDQTIPQRNGTNIIIFKETTRLISASNRKAIADPSPSNNLPFSETMYLRFTDTYIGNLFLKGDLTLSYYGLTYNMTNFRDINFSIFRIMGAERVSIILYLEPVVEGILIYSMSGLYLPEFISKRLNLTTNINNRITVLVNWITEGLRNQEVLAVQRDINALRNGLIQNDNFSRLLNN